MRQRSRLVRSRRPYRLAVIRQREESIVSKPFIELLLSYGSGG